MAGARRRCRSRSFSPSSSFPREENRNSRRNKSNCCRSNENSSSSSSSSRRARKGDRSVAAAPCLSGSRGRRERGLSSSSGSRERRRKGRSSTAAAEEASRAHATEGGKVSFRSRGGSKVTGKAEYKRQASPLGPQGDHAAEEMKERRKKKHLQQEAEGSRRRFSGQTSGRYDRQDSGGAFYHRKDRERGGDYNSSRYDGSSSSGRYDTTTNRYDNGSSKRYESSGSGRYDKNDSKSSKYDRSRKYEDSSSRSARGEDSSTTRYGDSSSSRFGGTGSTREEGGLRRYAGSESSVHGEKGSSSRLEQSGGKHGMPTRSTSGYGESNNSARYRDYSSGRYGKNSSSSSSGRRYSSAGASRDDMGRRNSACETGRWRRVSPFSHAEGRQEEDEERRNRRRSRQHSRCSRSGERDRSTGRRTRPERGGGGAAEEVTAPGGRRGGRGGRNEEAPTGAAGKGATAELRDSRTPGYERRRRSFEGDEEGSLKKQRLHAPAATIGSRASFLRSNAPAAPRVGGSSSLYGTERYKDEAGEDARPAAHRLTEQKEARRKDAAQPRGENRNVEGPENHMKTAKTVSEEESNKHFHQQQEGHQQRQQEDQTQRQREHADATERQQPQRSGKDTCLPSRSGAGFAAAGDEDQQRQLKRKRSPSEKGAAQRREASAETPILGRRTDAEGEVSKREGKGKEEEEQRQGEEKQQQGIFFAKRGEGAAESEELCTVGRVSGECEEHQQVKATTSKDRTAAAGTQHQERAWNCMQEEQKERDGLLQQDGEEAATAPAEREDEAAAAAALTHGTHQAAAGQEGEDPAAAGREKGMAERTEGRGGETIARKEGAGGSQGEAEPPGVTTEGHSTGGEENRVAAQRRAEGETVAAPGRETDGEPPGFGGTDTAAGKDHEKRAAGDSSYLAARRRAADADDGSGDGPATPDTAAKSEQEAEDSRISAVSLSPVCRTAAVRAQRGAGFSVGADRRSHFNNERAIAPETMQLHEEAAGAATAADVSSAARVASTRSPATAQAETAEATAAEGAASPGEGATGADAEAVAQQEGGDRSHAEEAAATGVFSGVVDGGGADTRATGEETTITAEASCPHDSVVALERGRTFPLRRDSRVSAAAGVRADEEEQQQQTYVEADQERFTNSSSSSVLQRSSHASWRVVTTAANVSSVKSSIRSGSASGTSGSGEGFRGGAEGMPRRRVRDVEEETRERGGGEARRRVWCRLPAPYGSPESQKQTPFFKHPRRPYPVPYSSSSSSLSSLRHNYSPSRPYSPSRDLSPGPCAPTSSAAFNRGDRHRIVHVPPAAYPASFPHHAAAVSSDSRDAAASPRAAVAARPFSPHGLAAAVDVRIRRGETAVMLLRERPAAAVSFRGRYGAQNGAPAPLFAGAPLAGPRVAQPQQQQHYQHQHVRKNNRSFFPAPPVVSSTLPRAGGRPPLRDAASSKFGVTKELHRKENSKWTHDLFEQVAREPEKTRRRFNLYSENLEIAE